MTTMASLPESRIPDPVTAPPLRWGVLAPGWVAHGFATALLAATSQKLAAVGSRNLARAQAFAAEFEIPAAHGSYAELLADPDVDAVYVASPHSEHAAHALAAIAAGKHVLIEKAFTQNAGQARQVIEAAGAAGVTVMEAMWLRFLPHVDVVRQLLADGVLGEVETVAADHGQKLGPETAWRLHDPAQAGGALLDLGVYPVSFAHFALGKPGCLVATGELTPTGVDRQVSVVASGFAGHPHAQALLSTTLAANTPTTATISGDLARVEFGPRFYAPGRVSLVTADTTLLSPEPALVGRGMAYEIAHFAQLAADGRRESPLMPLAESLAVIQTLDDLRSQVGVRYPGE